MSYTTSRPPECSTCDCPLGRLRDHVFGCGCVLCSCERFTTVPAAPLLLLHEEFHPELRGPEGTKVFRRMLGRFLGRVRGH